MEALEASQRIYRLLTEAGGSPTPKVRAWTGEVWGPATAPATIVLRHPGAWGALLFPPSDLVAAEAYVFDDIDIEGDIVELMRFAAELDRAGPLTVARLAALVRHLPRERRRHQTERPRMSGRLHSIRRDGAAVSHHYDTGNDFFRLFLDPLMVYSCAYYLDPSEPLETAQRRKLDLICRKLQLREGQRFLDVGCGWGALVVHAATHFGVEATGVTVSAEQATEASKAVAEAGVGDRVRIIHDDYRRVTGAFDAIASVGMVEHVGLGELGRYFTHLRRLLAPGGQVLNHGIVTRSRHRSQKAGFVRTYVFPDGELHTVDAAVAAAEEAGFEVRDVEALRRSYALTCAAWVRNLEANADAARALVGDRTYRIWRLYMAGSSVAFERGAIGVDQLLLADPARPWTYGRGHVVPTP